MAIRRSSSPCATRPRRSPRRRRSPHRIRPPLDGVPVAVKDNIDVAGLPTTAACPAFAYQPAHDATAVARLRAAGAIVIGKTNLDQFATGLGRRALALWRAAQCVRTRTSSRAARARARRSRSPPAWCRSRSAPTPPARAACRPALNNIVGLKPSLGLVSTAGVVPACRTLDCVSVFALTVDDALGGAGRRWPGRIAADPYSRAPAARRARRDAAGASGSACRAPASGCSSATQASEAAYEAALAASGAARRDASSRSTSSRSTRPRGCSTKGRGWPSATSRSRDAASRPHPDAMHPVTREIIARRRAADRGRRLRGVLQARGAAPRRAIAPSPTIDALVAADRADRLHRRAGAGRSDRSSTAGSAPTPISSTCSICAASRCRRRCATTACRSASRCWRRPGSDARLAAIGRVFHADTALPLGALGVPQPPLAALPVAGRRRDRDRRGRRASVRHAAQRRTARARRALLEATTTRRTTGCSRSPARRRRSPACCASRPATGAAIELEVWALPADGFGRFVAAVPAPLSIGTVTLADGRSVKGFLVEAEAIAGARDISRFGGWRAVRLAAGERQPRDRSATELHRLAPIGEYVDRVGSYSSRTVTICARIAAAAADAVAAQDRVHHAVMLDVRLREPAEIAELGAAERLHARPRRQRHLGEIVVVRAGIDGAVERLVDLVIALRIAALDQHAQLLVDRLERAAARPPSCARRQGRRTALRVRPSPRTCRPGAPRSGRATTAARCGARFDQAARRRAADRLAHRRARHLEAARQLGLVERGAGRQHAAHDLVGELQRAAPRRSVRAGAIDRGRRVGAWRARRRRHAGHAASAARRSG